MQQINIEDMVEIAQKLNSVELDFVFIGGGIIGFLIDDPLAFPVRTTKDIDVVLDVVTDPGQIRLEDKLRLAGFRHDMSDGAPSCRWIVDNVTVDILSIKDKFSGMNMRWLKETVESPLKVNRRGFDLRIASAPCFIAMKLEAFNDRGKSDYFGSRDIEDIISVVDGRSTLIEEITMADKKVKEFISETINDLMEISDFIISISGHLLPDPASQQRKAIVLEI